MAHTELNAAALSEVIEAARRPGLSIVERAALYAAAKAFAAELEEFIDDHYGPETRGYERDKLHSVISSLGIALGFAVYPSDRPHPGVWLGIDQDWHVFVSNMNSPYTPG